ncbi:MAG TPA: hypothetical protein VF274_06940 [Alphaproteobacteria bacterium]
MRLPAKLSRRAGAPVPLALLPLGLLAACAGTAEADYRGYIAQWVGKPVAQLTADWGRADYETEVRGQRELQYNFSEAVSYGERPIRISCSTRFLVDDAGIVRAAEAEGNACSTRNSGPAARGR